MPLICEKMPGCGRKNPRCWCMHPPSMQKPMICAKPLIWVQRALDVPKKELLDKPGCSSRRLAMDYCTAHHCVVACICAYMRTKLLNYAFHGWSLGALGFDQRATHKTSELLAGLGLDSLRQNLTITTGWTRFGKCGPLEAPV